MALMWVPGAEGGPNVPWVGAFKAHLCLKRRMGPVKLSEEALLQMSSRLARSLSTRIQVCLAASPPTSIL